MSQHASSTARYFFPFFYPCSSTIFCIVGNLGYTFDYISIDEAAYAKDDSLQRFFAPYFKQAGFFGIMNSTPVRGSQFDKFAKMTLNNDDCIAKVVVKARCDKCQSEGLWPCAHYTGRDSPWRASDSTGDVISRLFFEGNVEMFNREMMAEEGEDTSYLFPQEAIDNFKYNAAGIETWLRVRRPIIWMFFDPTPGPVSAAACVAVVWRYDSRVEKHEFMVRIKKNFL